VAGNRPLASVETNTFRVSMPRPAGDKRASPVRRPDARSAAAESGVPWLLVLVPTLVLGGAGAALAARGRVRSRLPGASA
jgi:hypothetical protein